MASANLTWRLTSQSFFIKFHVISTEISVCRLCALSWSLTSVPHPKYPVPSCLWNFAIVTSSPFFSHDTVPSQISSHFAAMSLRNSGKSEEAIEGTFAQMSRVSPLSFSFSHSNHDDCCGAPTCSSPQRKLSFP